MLFSIMFDFLFLPPIFDSTRTIAFITSALILGKSLQYLFSKIEILKRIKGCMETQGQYDVQILAWVNYWNMTMEKRSSLFRLMTAVQKAT